MTEDFCLLTRRFCFLSTVPPPWKLISTSEAKTLEWNAVLPGDKNKNHQIRTKKVARFSPVLKCLTN
jgi:hypothetical protein